MTHKVREPQALLRLDERPFVARAAELALSEIEARCAASFSAPRAHSTRKQHWRAHEWTARRGIKVNNAREVYI